MSNYDDFNLDVRASAGSNSGDPRVVTFGAICVASYALCLQISEMICTEPGLCELISNPAYCSGDCGVGSGSCAEECNTQSYCRSYCGGACRR